jgi:hypothetical protein
VSRHLWFKGGDDATESSAFRTFSKKENGKKKKLSSASPLNGHLKQQLTLTHPTRKHHYY